MSKSIKLKNNTYLDSSGITHNRDLLSTLLTTLTGQVGGLSSQVTDLNNRIYIQETGSNSNGTYIRWSNGFQICYKTMTYNGVNCNTVWGSLYESTKLSIGNYAKSFISTPVISLTPNNPFLVEKYGDTSSTSFGSWYMVRPKSGSAGDNASLFCIAIGMWK